MNGPIVLIVKIKLVRGDFLRGKVVLDGLQGLEIAVKIMYPKTKGGGRKGTAFLQAI